MALHSRAKTARGSAIVLVISLLLVIGVIGAAAAAPAPKVDVCHYDADTATFHLINISENAFQAHVDHGDASPGEAVPGMPGFVFDAECGIPPRLAAEGASTSNYGGGVISVGFTLYQATDGTYSGSGVYDWTVTGHHYDFAIADACLDDAAGVATVWGPGTSSTVGTGFGMLSLKDYGAGSMGTRAGFTASMASLPTAQQCSTSAIFPATGVGFLTFS